MRRFVALFAVLLAIAIPAGAAVLFTELESGDELTVQCNSDRLWSDRVNRQTVDLLCTGPTTTTAPAPTTTTAPAPTTTTAPPPTTTTAPPTTTTTTAPPSGGFPNATNTGVPAGVTLTPSGSLTVSTDGAVVSGLDISGELFINANNVTVRNTRVRFSGTYYAVRIDGDQTGFAIEDADIVCVGSAHGYGVYGPFQFARRLDISGCENGLNPAYGGANGALIEDNFIHDFAGASDAHFDGVTSDGGIQGLTIRHNNIVVNHGQTSAIMIDNYFAGSSNILIENNRLRGGGYNIYCDAGFQAAPITGVVIRNNRLGGWVWGPWAFKNCTPSKSGNVNDDTGAPIT